MLARAHGIAPGLTGDLLGFISGLILPKSTPGGSARPGWSLQNLRSPKMRVALMLGRMAARRLNQRMA
jgi:hypothetical protein